MMGSAQKDLTALRNTVLIYFVIAGIAWIANICPGPVDVAGGAACFIRCSHGDVFPFAKTFVELL